MPDTFAPTSPQDDLEALLDTVWREEKRARLYDRMDAMLRADELAKGKPTRARKRRRGSK